VESSEKMREELAESLRLNEKRAHTLEELFKVYTQPGVNKTAIPIQEVLTAMQFETAEELEDWLLDNYNKATYFSGAELIIINTLPD